MWNLWHGCHKLSPGCKHCYVYRGDAKRDVDSSVVRQTKNFDLPLRKKRNGDYKVPAGTLVYTCFTSDFFVEDADLWRSEAWQMMQQRSDLNFLIITKRIDRFAQCMPEDWSDGYNNVTICCTAESRRITSYNVCYTKLLRTYFQSEADAEAFLTGCYNAITYHGWWQIENFWILTDMCSDDLWMGNTTQDQSGYISLAHYQGVGQSNGTIS